jgi:hypothetical protein
MIQASPTGRAALAPDLDPPVKPSVALYARWRTWGKAGPHGAHLKIADKDEAAGSSPARPTKAASTSGNAGHCGFSASPTMDPVWDQVLRALPLVSQYNASEQRLCDSTVVVLRQMSVVASQERCKRLGTRAPE